MSELLNISDEPQYDAAELGSRFLRAIPLSFRRAAEKLEFQNILDAHLRQATTALGRAALVSELTPSSQKEKIVTSLKEIDELRRMIEAGEAPSFAGIIDLRNALHKVELEGSTIYQDEGLAFVTTLRTMRLLRDFFAKRNASCPTLWRSAIHLFEDRLLEMSFDAVFDENGSVRDNASAELHSIRREIVSTSERLRNKLAALIKKYTEDDLLQEQIVTLRDGRSVIPVKAEHKRKIAGMIHSVSQTGQTIYLEPSETIDLNNELRSLEFSEQREIDRILRELTERLRASVRPFLKSLELVGHLDAVHAKARYANSIYAITPVVQFVQRPEERTMSLVSARHPFLISKIGKERTVAFSLSLDSSCHTLILTGPNAGGKTVLLKTVGLMLLLSHAGLPIPAEEGSVITCVEGVYVDIGDSQSIADDLSTFSSHVKSLKEIITSINEYSVVLLDEIGSGTAPEEGGALAESILEYLTGHAAFTIATTHYGRLAGFAEAEAGAVNGSMEFDSTTLEPTYRFHLGIPGSSHAFEIAERYQFPKQIVGRARELAGSGSNRLEQLIDRLSDKEQELTKRNTELDQELGKARFQRLDLERQLSEVTAQKNTMLREASKKADDILSSANTYIERAIREAREAANKEHKGQQTVDLSELRRKQQQELKTLTTKVEEHLGVSVAKSNADLVLEIGSKVKLLSNPDQVGDVVSIEGKEAEILFGSIKMRVKISQLEVISKAEARKEERSKALKQGAYFDEMFSPRIDLRGKYGDEGVMEVEKYLSDANARNIQRVEILHGTGTGALGRRIQQYLRTAPFVASFRYGDRHEGGMGVTIVELKQ